MLLVRCPFAGISMIFVCVVNTTLYVVFMLIEVALLGCSGLGLDRLDPQIEEGNISSFFETGRISKIGGSSIFGAEDRVASSMNNPSFFDLRLGRTENNPSSSFDPKNEHCKSAIFGRRTYNTNFNLPLLKSLPRWGVLQTLFNLESPEDRVEDRPLLTVASKIGEGSSKMGTVLRIIFPIFDLRRRKMEGPSIFDLAGRRILEPPIFNFLGRKNEDPPFFFRIPSPSILARLSGVSIFGSDLYPRRSVRRSRSALYSDTLSGFLLV